jgi:ribonuclease HII
MMARPRIPSPKPTIDLEARVCRDEQVVYVAGLDEAGRGALAGPVVAAAVILPLDDPARLEKLQAVKDSKLLSPRRREALYELILENATSYGVGSASAREIDRSGILAANNQAMLAAVAQLEPAPQFLLVDGPLYLRRTLLRQKPVVRGDTLSLTIAAASILAKVSRDRLMLDLDEQYPHYGFCRHKGYATAYHLNALAEFGPAACHRQSFAPIRRRLL